MHLFKEAVAAAHSDLRQLGERDRSRIESCSETWADGWIRIILNQTFDTHLPNMAFHDTLCIRFGLLIFDIDEEYRLYSQNNDMKFYGLEDWKRIGSFDIGGFCV